MAVIVWSGRGYLVVVVTLAVMVLTQWATAAAYGDERYYDEHAWPISVGLAISGALSVGLSRRLDRPRTSPLEQPSLAAPNRAARDTLFFIPVRSWSFILLSLAVVHAATGSLDLNRAPNATARPSSTVERRTIRA